MKWEAKSIKYLRMLISHNLGKIYERNYKLINNKIQDNIRKWSTLGSDFHIGVRMVDFQFSRSI